MGQWECVKEKDMVPAFTEIVHYVVAQINTFGGLSALEDSSMGVLDKGF